MQSHGFRTGALPQDPTEALPGSEQKIRVMTERATRREALFHPEDGLVAAPPTVRAVAPAWWRKEGNVITTPAAQFLEPVILEDDDFALEEAALPPMDRAG